MCTPTWQSLTWCVLRAKHGFKLYIRTNLLTPQHTHVLSLCLTYRQEYGNTGKLKTSQVGIRNVNIDTGESGFRVFALSPLLCSQDDSCLVVLFRVLFVNEILRLKFDLSELGSLVLVLREGDMNCVISIETPFTEIVCANNTHIG